MLPLPSEINGGEFHEGVATIFNFEGRPLRVIDTEGKTVFTCDQFSEIGSFYNGVAVARDLMGKYGLIDKNGAWIVNPQYDYMDDLRGNTVIVNLGDYDGVIDLAGNEVIPCTYSDISYQDAYTDGVRTSDEHPLFLLSTDSDEEGLADENGTILIQPQEQFNLTGDFSDGVCGAIYYPYKDKPIPLDVPIPKGLVDLSGQELTGPIYEEVLACDSRKRTGKRPVEIHQCARTDGIDPSTRCSGHQRLSAGAGASRCTGRGELFNGLPGRDGLWAVAAIL